MCRTVVVKREPSQTTKNVRLTHPWSWALDSDSERMRLCLQTSGTSFVQGDWVRSWDMWVELLPLLIEEESAEVALCIWIGRLLGASLWRFSRHNLMGDDPGANPELAEGVTSHLAWEWLRASPEELESFASERDMEYPDEWEKMDERKVVKLNWRLNCLLRRPSATVQLRKFIINCVKSQEESMRRYMRGTCGIPWGPEANGWMDT